jgi:hypothetical protein
VSIHIEYQRAGVSHVVRNVLTDPEFTVPLSWWQRHLLAFRAISLADCGGICHW